MLSSSKQYRSAQIHFILASFLTFGLQSICYAGMDIDQYLPPPPPITDQAEAEKQRQRVAAEQEQARKSAQAEAEALALEQTRLELARAQRPLAIKLIEARCSNCHESDDIFNKGRSRMAWEAVVLRMQWFNGAELNADERSIIASWLSTEYGVPTWRKIIEVVLIPIAAIASFGLVRIIRTRRNKETRT